MSISVLAAERAAEDAGSICCDLCIRDICDTSVPENSCFLKQTYFSTDPVRNKIIWNSFIH